MWRDPTTLPPPPDEALKMVIFAKKYIFWLSCSLTQRFWWDKRDRRQFKKRLNLPSGKIATFIGYCSTLTLILTFSPACLCTRLLSTASPFFFSPGDHNWHETRNEILEIFQEGWFFNWVFTLLRRMSEMSEPRRWARRGRGRDPRRGVWWCERWGPAWSGPSPGWVWDQTWYLSINYHVWWGPTTGGEFVSNIIRPPWWVRDGRDGQWGDKLGKNI